jgi:uncharacterized secreted protein with C-terminal beta-propeller domain
MSVVKRGARAGVAAFALGLSLAGPQAAGVAAADEPDGDTPSASSSSDSPSREIQRGSRAPRPTQTAVSGTSAPRRGAVTTPPALLDDVAPTVAVVIPPVGATGAVGVLPPAPEPARDSAPEAPQPHTPSPAAAATPSVPRSNGAPVSAPVTDSPVPAALPSPAAAVPTTVPSVPRPAAAANAVIPTVVATPPAPAKPVAIIGQAVTSFFDTAANWLTSLPNGPLSNFLEGALLMVRRTFFQIFPELNISHSTGQSAPNPAYFTEEELRGYLLELAKQQYGGLYGQTVPVYGYGPYPYPEYALKANSTATPPSSDTNTQVNGVDEADYVETDGKYLYVAHNGQLTIVRADDLSVTSQSALSGNVLGEYLSGNRLTVVSQSGSGWYGPVVKMAYGPWQPWKPQTTVTVYDVTDRTAPTVVEQTTFDGSYQSSRAVDGTVYLVLQRSVQLPAPNYTDTPINYIAPVDGVSLDANADGPEAKIRYDPSDPIANRTYETWDEYVARVGGDIVSLSLPHAYTVNADGTTVDLGLVADAGDIARPQTPDQQSLVTVVSVDSTRNGGPVDSVATMVSGWASTVYMTKGALYVATNQDTYTDTTSSTDTRIDRFIVAGPLLGWQGTGVVSGTLINQFAMDEKDGYLRVATHTTSSENIGGSWTTRNDSGIYVLDTASLDQVGQLTGLAPGEQLYAVRYVGDTAYLVTFLQTDPLFAIDLSDPKAPELQGELVVPGFSNYLQSVGDGLLLGIGQERETGSWNTHLQATLFDVADGYQPTQIDREYLDSGYQWSWSDAQFDHHALLYSAADGLLVVPVAASGYDPQTGYRYSQYLKVLRVGPAGLESVGEIHPGESVQRTVRIGDVLYAVGDTSVTAYRLSDLSEIGTTAAAPSVV